MTPFQYHRPAEAGAARAAFEGDARYLAGGQSLVQAMKLGLSASERLIDLGAVAGLSGIRQDGADLVMGAMTPHAEVAESAAVRQGWPGLAELAGGIGDPAVRSRGTLGGAIANADPAACYPAALLALSARVQTDRREIAAEDFFTGLYETALAPGELVTAVRFPTASRTGYAKLKQPASRFALVGVFVAQGAWGVRVAVTGVRASVFRCEPLEAALVRSFTPEAARAVRITLDDAMSDLHASGDYRAAMVPVMAARAVAAALAG